MRQEDLLLRARELLWKVDRAEHSLVHENQNWIDDFIGIDFACDALI